MLRAFFCSIAPKALFVVALLIAGCDRSPMLIGFAGPLTGPYSDLGVHGRNGVQLAMEEINAAGGVAGRRLELLVRDDHGSAEGAVQADEEMIRAGVRAIIGHMTSAQSVAVLPLIQKSEVVLLSPTTSTPELNGIKDYFFRVQPSTDTAAVALAGYAAREMGLSRLAVVLDMGNRAYTESFYRHFLLTFTDHGGSLGVLRNIDSGVSPDWVDIALLLDSEEHDGVFAILSARDLAALAQAMNSQGLSPSILSSGWAMTEDLLQVGGRTVENIVFAGHTFQERKNPEHIAFQKRYQQRFGHSPSFAAAYAYDAMRVLAVALETTKGRRAGLPGALSDIRDFPGLHWPITIDLFGDTISPIYITTVRDGQFVALQQLMPLENQ